MADVTSYVWNYGNNICVYESPWVATLKDLFLITTFIKLNPARIWMNLVAELQLWHRQGFSFSLPHLGMLWGPTNLLTKVMGWGVLSSGGKVAEAWIWCLQLLSSFESRSVWIFAFSPLNVFMAWCLIWIRIYFYSYVNSYKFRTENTNHFCRIPFKQKFSPTSLVFMLYVSNLKFKFQWYDAI
jgi:hypothetical protein